MGQIGSVRVQTPSGTLVLPVFSLDTAGLTNRMVRVQTPNGIGCFDLVPIGHQNASPVRVQTPNGIYCISKSQPAVTKTYSLSITSDQSTWTNKMFMGTDSIPVAKIISMTLKQKGGYGSQRTYATNFYVRSLPTTNSYGYGENSAEPPSDANLYVGVTNTNIGATDGSWGYFTLTGDQLRSYWNSKGWGTYLTGIAAWRSGGYIDNIQVDITYYP